MELGVWTLSHHGGAGSNANEAIDISRAAAVRGGALRSESPLQRHSTGELGNGFNGSNRALPGRHGTKSRGAPPGLRLLTVANAAAAAAGGIAVPARQHWVRNCLMICLAGQQRPIEWQVTFASATG